MVGATVTDDEAPVFSYESLNEVILKRSLIHTSPSGGGGGRR